MGKSPIVDNSEAPDRTINGEDKQVRVPYLAQVEEVISTENGLGSHFGHVKCDMALGIVGVEPKVVVVYESSFLNLSVVGKVRNKPWFGSIMLGVILYAGGFWLVLDCP
ncbi:hypothetical protein U1Q18_008248 [Sarracenia purpurea var. burkii]